MDTTITDVCESVQIECFSTNHDNIHHYQDNRGVTQSSINNGGVSGGDEIEVICFESNEPVSNQTMTSVGVGSSDSRVIRAEG